MLKSFGSRYSRTAQPGQKTVRHANRQALIRRGKRYGLLEQGRGLVVRSLGNLQQEALRSALAVAGRYLYHQHAAFETLWALRYDGAVRPGAHSSLLAADVHASRT